jgi:hypothetical protein
MDGIDVARSRWGEIAVHQRRAGAPRVLDLATAWAGTAESQLLTRLGGTVGWWREEYGPG